VLACVASAHAGCAEPTYPGIETATETLTLRDGVKLRAIVTKPVRASAPLPAILFVQWLSCDSVEISGDPRDGWSAMLERIVRGSNALVWRTQKRGVGGSEGDCATLDYEAELADHREALAALRRRPDVDPRRIVVFGGSIGGTYAPLLAADQDLAGVLVWGAGAATWAERMLRFERNALELGGDPSELAREMTARYRFFDRYLLDGATPPEIAAADPELGAVWQRIVGASASGHYGRPFAFHQQAQRADWAGAWARVRAPVLAMLGEYDWFESREPGALIARIVDARSPGRGTFVEVPRMNHHFERFETAADAFHERNGVVDPAPAVEPMLEWLARVLR
jgi:dienelactone hydrolase